MRNLLLTAFWVVTHLLTAQSLEMRGIPSCAKVEMGAIAGIGVDVVSGQYMELIPDLVVNCHEPIYVFRSHKSDDIQGPVSIGTGSMVLGGWNCPCFWREDYRFYPQFHLHDERIHVEVERHNRSRSLRLVEAIGTELFFDTEGDWNPMPSHGTDRTFWVQDPPDNTSGIVSAQTSYANYALHFSGERTEFELTTGNGERRYYQLVVVAPEGTRCDKKGRNRHDCYLQYALYKVIKPSGNHHLYEYEDGRLAEIRSTNADETRVYGWVRFEPLEDGLLLTSSDGQEVRYERDRFNPLGVDRIYRNGRLETVYELSKIEDIWRLTRSHPGGQTLQITYEEEEGVRKVKEQRLLSEDENQLIAKFAYFSDEETGYLATRVIDGADRSCYYKHYVDGSRKSIIVLPDGDYIRLERGDDGNLQRKTYLGKNTKINKEFRLATDQRGNLAVFTHRWDRSTPELRADVRQTTCCFSDDAFNLVLRESNGAQTFQYSYQSGANLLTSRLLLERGVIQERCFYTYADSVLVQTILDDGSTADPDSMEGVSYRLITTVTPREESPGLAMPAIIERYYCDPATGENHLLWGERLHYSDRNWVVQRDIYDANNDLRYSVFTEYDVDGRVTMQTDALGQATQFTYDQLGNCIHVDGAKAGHTIDCSYNLANQLTSRTISDAYGNCFKQTLRTNLRGDDLGGCDEIGNFTLKETNSYGGPFKTIYPFVEDSSGFACQYRRCSLHDPWGFISEERDEMGYVTKSSLNLTGDPLSIDYPDNTRETYAYDSVGRVAEKRCRNGMRIHYTYDYADRITTRSCYDSGGTLLSCESAVYKGKLLTSATAADGQVTDYNYDAAGRLVEERCGRHRLRYGYDSLGRRTHTYRWYDCDDSDYTVAIQEFDLLDRCIEARTENAWGSALTRQQYTYDECDNRIAVAAFDAAGNLCETHTEYDCLNTPIAATDPDGNTTSIEKQVVTCELTLAKTGELESVNNPRQVITDPSGCQKVLTYDARGRLTSQQRLDPQGSQLTHGSYVYDGCGNLIRETQHRGKQPPLVTECSYGPMSRVERMTEAVGTPSERTTAYKYNAAGLLSAIVKPSGDTQTFDYDTQGRLHCYSGPDFDYTYECDPCGRLVTVVAADSSETVRAYDYEGHLIFEQLANGLELRYEVDAQGRRTKILLPDGSAIGYQHDALFLRQVARLDCNGRICYSHDYSAYDLSGRLLEAFPITGGQPIKYEWDACGRLLAHLSPWYSANATYDCLGNVLTLLCNDPDGNLTRTFTYDDLNQLLTESDHAYSYDAIGNRTSCDSENYQVNDLNELLSSPAGNFTYDADGRIVTISRGSEAFLLTYDALDRLVRFEGSQLAVQFGYDAFNRRLSKEVYLLQEESWTLQSRLRFLWVDDFEIGAVDDSGVIVELRVLGIGQGGEAGATVAVELDGEVYQPIHDFSGNLAGLLTLDGRIAEWYQFSAFGEGSRSSMGNPWCFAGKRIDEETGFVYFGHRYYLPEVGRWLTCDPAGGVDGPNAYTYTHNNPLAFMDSTGCWSWNINGFPIGGGGGTSGSSGSSGVLGTLGSLGTPTDAIGAGPITGLIYLPVLASPSSYPYCGPANDYRDYVTWDLDWENDGRSIRSHRFDLSDLGRVDIAGIRIVFMNGMATSVESTRQYAEYFSDCLGGPNVHVVYNSSNNGWRDFCECRRNLNFVCTNPTDKLIEEIENFDKEAMPQDHLLIGCHSQAAIHARNALMVISQALRNRISVLAVAPGAFIWPTLCAHQVHLVSGQSCTGLKPRFDFVPMLDYKGRKICRDTTVVLKPHPDASCHDHGFMSPTYTEPIKRRGLAIVEMYRRDKM